MSAIDKVIEIKCGGEVFFDFEELKFFQGELKYIKVDDFTSLKKSLIENGLPLAFHIWINEKGEKYILDGTHRVKAFYDLRKDGFLIPKIPCNIVNAKSKKEAAKFLLINNSKYAKMTNDRLFGFMNDTSLELPDIENLILPDIDMSDFMSVDLEPVKEDDADKEESEKKDEKFYICSNCGAENLK